MSFLPTGCYKTLQQFSTKYIMQDVYASVILQPRWMSTEDFLSALAQKCLCSEKSTFPLEASSTQLPCIILVHVGILQQLSGSVRPTRAMNKDV